LLNSDSKDGMEDEAQGQATRLSFSWMISVFSGVQSTPVIIDGRASLHLPLRSCPRCEMGETPRTSRALEAALAQDGSQCKKGQIVEHAVGFS
jgi:hypothetical protein